MTWPRVPLDDVKSTAPYSLVGGPFGSELTTRNYVAEGVPVIRGNNLVGPGKFLDEDFVYVNDEKATLLRSNTAYPGDLIFTQRGTLGQVGLIPKDARFNRYIVSQSQMKLTVEEQKAEPLFLYYFFRLPSTVQQILNRVSLSGVPHINLSVLKAFKIPLPPKPTQKGIVQIAQPYDDLIENNRRRIRLLEDAARLLYQEWFVRFRFPGHEHVKVINGVPEGWSRPTLGEYAPLQYGKALREDQRQEGSVPVFGSSGIVGNHNLALVSESGIVVGRKGNVGAVYLSNEPFWPIETTYYIDGTKATRFLYYSLLATAFLNTDVAVPGLNRDFAHSRHLVVPPDPLLKIFEETVAPIFRMATVLDREIAALSKARDLILPKLMSGEVEV